MFRLLHNQEDCGLQAVLGEIVLIWQPASIMGLQKNKAEDPKLGYSKDCYWFKTWNVRTQTGKELELIGEMKRYRLDVLGVSEGKIRGKGMKTVEGVTCVYSGVQGERLSVSFSFVHSWRRLSWPKCPAISCWLILLHICSQWFRLHGKWKLIGRRQKWWRWEKRENSVVWKLGTGG